MLQPASQTSAALVQAIGSGGPSIKQALHLSKIHLVRLVDFFNCEHSTILDEWLRMVANGRCCSTCKMLLQSDVPSESCFDSHEVLDLTIV